MYETKFVKDPKYTHILISFIHRKRWIKVLLHPNFMNLPTINSLGSLYQV